jgi:hypothetical protein
VVGVASVVEVIADVAGADEMVVPSGGLRCG